MEQSKRPRAFYTGLEIYRRTLKRIRPAHRAAHWLATHTALPMLETMNGFHTMPDDPFWFRLELLTNQHESETVTCLRQLLRPGMTVLDVGAHVGYYARMTAQLVGESGRVIAFEPHPRNREYLTRNTARHSNVHIVPVAASEAEGTAELHDYLLMSASGSLHYDEALRNAQQAQASDHDYAPRGRDFQPVKYTVRTAPIDDLLAELAIPSVDIIKMDIEGAELMALRGARQTIAQSPALTLIMEYNPLGLRAFGHDPIGALDEIMELGFDTLALIDTNSQAKPLAASSDALLNLTEQLTHNMGVVNLLLRRATSS